ncbi:hypothetical protein H2136_02995 [Aeromonas hydrophila]|uniref:Uncharacterized protein n=1 Tax=Aeromonas hydrophila TaxID=644 RepID=A0A926FH75_AERHY|nr:hypothetical protein [Aeromonas hydrophila]
MSRWMADGASLPAPAVDGNLPAACRVAGIQEKSDGILLTRPSCCSPSRRTSASCSRPCRPSPRA